MRNIFLLTFIFIFTAVADATEMKRIGEFGSNPGNLNMYLYTPVKNDSSATKLLFVLHGCTQSAGDVARLTGWNKLADLYGFYIVYPEQKVTNNLSNCFNWFLEKDISGNGETKSIYSMYEYMTRNYTIDTNAVFITGLSAGAAMSVALMSVYPGKFNAGAIFAGAPYGIATNALKVAAAIAGSVTKTMDEWKKLVTDQNPGYSGKYPRIIIFQGEDDPIVNKSCSFELIKQWAALWESDTIPEESETGFKGNPDVKRQSYYDSNGQKFMTHYLGKNTGHVLYINPGKCRNMGGEKGVYGKVQELHSTWYAALEMGIIPDQKIQTIKEKDGIYTLKIPSYHGSQYFWKIPSDWKYLSSDSTSTVRVVPGKLPAKVLVLEKDSLDCYYEYSTQVSE